MAYHRKNHNRRSIRLPGYDYRTPGAYFVTVCVRAGECLLGEVLDGEMLPNEMGQVAEDFWAQVPVHFPTAAIDVFVIMPNHLHAIVEIRSPEDIDRAGEEEGEGTSPLQIQGAKDDHDICRGAVTVPSQAQMRRSSLGRIVAYYKYQTTKEINCLREMPGVPFWQRNYWEHVVRNEGEMNRIRKYIENNPARWADDQLHPDAPPNRFNRWQLPGRST